MFKRILWLMVLLVSGWFLAQQGQAQSVNGLLTGTITDTAGAIVPGVQIAASDKVTGETRKAVTDNQGVWLIPQLPPATYKVTVARQGFATIVEDNVVLDVNQSVTLDFKLKVAAQNETVQVTTAPPLLDTTSATISTIVSHQEVVDLPLDGREFTQLALLSPGAAPTENAQQGSFAIAEGGGGISPSTNGQRGEENNFTIDGIENNELFDNAWAISPPPEAIEEFNVQAHMTDAQFSVSSGANINVQTRSGTNSFHGDAWEYVRNNALDANQYPNPKLPAYHENQYGFFVGGPIIRKHTYFSGYWEGYRYNKGSATFGNTLTANEIAGDFSQYVGTTPIGTDDLGRPEYQYEIYDATTSRPDPLNPALTIRDPFPAANGKPAGTQVPSTYFNSNSLIYFKKFYPAPNLNVAPGVFPNFEYTGIQTIKSDQFGARFDQRLNDNNTAFVRLARNNAHKVSPAAFNTLPGGVVTNFADEAEFGFTHIFDPKTILNIRAAYVDENLKSNSGDTFDPALTQAMGTQLVSVPRLGANVPIEVTSIGNSLGGISNVYNPLGPSSFYEYNADISRTMGHHTISGGGLFFPLRQVADVVIVQANPSQAGSSVNGNTSGATGFGPASYLEGIIDQFYTYNLIKNLDLTVPWWGWYAQDQWQVNRKLVVDFGIRWDYLAESNYHARALEFDASTDKMYTIGSPAFTVPTSFLPVGNPVQYQGTQGYFAPRKNGWQPRFGATYEVKQNTVAHIAFAMFDQHDNQMTQGNENVALNWPNGDNQTKPNLDIGKPQMYFTTLPTEASLLSLTNPALGTNANQSQPISYVEEYNAGIQQQFAGHLSLNVDYVGSVGRHQWTTTTANTAEYPGPGPIAARAQYPQYGQFGYFSAEDSTSYNGLQAKLTRPFSSGVTFTASYTYSKSLDNQSDPYSGPQPRYYNFGTNWGPSNYNIPQVFVFSGVYQLPFGKGRMFMQTPNKFVQEVLGDWQTAGILQMHSGLPFYVNANGDVANTGWAFEPAQRGTMNPYHQSGGGAAGFKYWLTPPTADTPTALPTSTFAFAQPLQYTIGNARRNDLIGPNYKDVDFSLQKNFPIWESLNFQFRSEFFNLFNHENYANPGTGIATPASFGQITGISGNARVIQLSGKIDF